MVTRRAGRRGKVGDLWPRSVARTDPPRWSLLLIIPIVAVLATSWVGLGIDVKYALGALQTAESGGAGTVFDIFLHRPLAFRLLLDLLDSVRGLITDDPSGAVGQVVVRVAMCLLVAGAAALLWLGLRHHLDEATARLVAAASGTALALASNFHFLTADWVGVVAATAAVGAALTPRRLTIACTLAAFFLFLTVAVKIATAPWAFLAVCIVAYWSWQRALLSAATSAGIGVVWVAATAAFDPIEIEWLLDSVRAVSSAPPSGGLGSWVTGLVVLFANMTVVSPVLVVTPAAIVAIAMQAGRARIAALLVASLLLACASGIGQGEGFAYQYAGVPVLAAAITAGGVTLTRSPTTRGILLAGLALTAFASSILLGAPLEWRREHFSVVALAYTCTAFALLILTAISVRREGQRFRPPNGELVVGAAAIALSFLAAGLPNSAYAFDGFDDHYTNIGLVRAEATTRQAYAEARSRIGPTTPVLYLAYGTKNYLLQNPTPCRYPSPVFLARSTHNPAIRSLGSYRDNVTCFNASVGYLVVDRSWADPEKMEAALRDVVAKRFDCTRGFQLRDSTSTVEFCPAR